jgi:DNA helicase HerA-like ATPase
VYSSKFPYLAPENVISDARKDDLFAAIDALSNELEKFANQQNKSLIASKTSVLKDLFYEAVKEFMQSDKRIALFELPDVSNTTGILEYTKWFFRGLFQIARQDANFGKQVCVVLEEAHTVIPEWNFIGVEERKAQSLVNSISQIALQGRKYNVGFIVVAQRTANVSKTILTQCNSIVAFQQFDKTSADFLTNYMGVEMVAALPALRFRQAIAVGKAFRSGVPMIFEVPNIEEPKLKED